jgi:hypothetical protein
MFKEYLWKNKISLWQDGPAAIAPPDEIDGEPGRKPDFNPPSTVT